MVPIASRGAGSQSDILALCQRRQPVDCAQPEPEQDSPDYPGKHACLSRNRDQQHHVDKQKRADDDERQTVRRNQRSQRRGRYEHVRPAAVDNEAGERPEHQRDQRHGPQLGQRPPDVQVGQMIGRIQIGQRGHDGRQRPAPEHTVRKGVHACGGRHQRERIRAFQRRGQIQSRDVEQFGHVVWERSVEVEDRMAVSKPEFREPAGVERAGCHRVIQTQQPIKMQHTIVRYEVAAVQQRCDGRQAQEQNPDQSEVKPPEKGQEPSIRVSSHRALATGCGSACTATRS